MIEQVDPLFPAGTSLPLSALGGVSYPRDHCPGRLRAFAATLATPMPASAKKHDTSNTRSTTTNRTQTSDDGKVRNDTISDTSTDT
jgi:hypothetical protein